MLQSWERRILQAELKAASLPETLPTPIQIEDVDLAAREQLSANLWSKLFPALLVIMALTGAFYPAIDLCAGEKERGTMETLLICPASRTEIVLGKFLTVLLFSVTTALLNLSSLGFTGKYMVSLAGGGAMSNRVRRPAGGSDCRVSAPTVTAIPANSPAAAHARRRSADVGVALAPGWTGIADGSSNAPSMARRRSPAD